MRSRHEAKIVRGAQRFLEPGETVIRALVAVPRGYTQRMAGEPQLGAAQMERAIEGAGRAGVELATPTGLVLTSQRLLTLRLSTAWGLGVGGSVQELLTAIPLADVDEIVIRRLLIGQTIALTVRNESFRLEANALACGRALAKAFVEAKAARLGSDPKRALPPTAHLGSDAECANQAEHPALALLREARALVARPGNRFVYSSWEDAEHALGEIDGLIAGIASGTVEPARSAVLFAPTGPLQELSLDSGWGDEFVDLAHRFDACIAQPPRS